MWERLLCFSWSISRWDRHLIWHMFGGLQGRCPSGAEGAISLLSLCYTPPWVPSSHTLLRLEFQQEFYMHLVPWSLRVLPRGALASRGLAIPKFQGTGRRGETVLDRLPPAGPSSDRGLKDTPVLLLWRTVCLSWSFGLRGKF